MAYPSNTTGSPFEGNASPTTSPNYVDLFKTAYADTIRLKAQNMDSVLSDTCVPEVLMGDPLMLDSYKSIELLQRGRGVQYGADTAIGDVEYKQTGTERRQLTPEFWEFAELFDPRDERGLMRAIQPDGTYVMNVASAFNRKKDDVIIDAFRGDVTIDGTALTSGTQARTQLLHSFRKDVDVAYGGAVTGITGQGANLEIGDAGDSLNTTGSVSGNNIGGTIGALVEVDVAGESGCQQVVAASADKLDGTTAVTTLHLKKILTGLEVLQTNGIPSGTKIYCAIGPMAVSELMEEAQYTSADYNALRPLQYGEPTEFLGVEFRVTPQITTETVLSGYNSTTNLFQIGTGGHYAYLYTDQAMVFGLGDDMSVRFDEIPHRGYSLQCFHDFSLGSVRMDAKQMVIIPNHSSTAGDVGNIT